MKDKLLTSFLFAAVLVALASAREQSSCSGTWNAGNALQCDDVARLQIAKNQGVFPLRTINASGAGRLQCFNVLNHYNFGTPDDSVSNPTFGFIFYGEQSPTGTLGSGFNSSTGARMIQLKAEVRF